MNGINAANVQKLCNVIENLMGYPLLSPKDFNALSENVFKHTHVLVSPSTLMRLWGYIKSDVTPRLNTLSALARFAGYRDWTDLCQSDTALRQSNPIVARHLSVETDLKRGQQVRLSWSPNRICDIVYLGSCSFRVVNSINTGLKKDTTFKCTLIIEGEPLYLDNVVGKEIPVCKYVCGKRNGVYFSLLTDDLP